MPLPGEEEDVDSLFQVTPSRFDSDLEVTLQRLQERYGNIFAVSGSTTGRWQNEPPPPPPPLRQTRRGREIPEGHTSCNLCLTVYPETDLSPDTDGILYCGDCFVRYSQCGLCEEVMDRTQFRVRGVLTRGQDGNLCVSCSPDPKKDKLTVKHEMHRKAQTNIMKSRKEKFWRG
jgi:hypothetical protein